MKRIFCLTVVSLFVFVLGARLFAEEPEWVCPLNRKEMIMAVNKSHRQRMDNMAAVLRLTPEQRDKISSIITEGRDKVAAARDELIDLIVTTEISSNRDIKSVLNEEQARKYTQIEAEHHERLGDKMKRWFNEGMCY